MCAPVPDRRDPPVTGVTGTAGDLYGPLAALAAALARWDGRSAAAATAAERKAASRAVAQIDVMLLALHGMRARLITETREADAAADARADALLEATGTLLKAYVVTEDAPGSRPDLDMGGCG